MVQTADSGSMLSVVLPEDFYQVMEQSARNYFLTPGVCLQARDCIWNALGSSVFFLVEIW